MEKQGVVKPGVTPDTEKRLDGQKTADTKTATKVLDDDFSKRAAQRMADGLKRE